MFVKIVADVGGFAPYHIIEAKHVTWRDIGEGETEDIPDMYDIGDYGVYSTYKKVRLELTLDDSHFWLECGVVYIMNSDGKTIDTIHA